MQTTATQRTLPSEEDDEDEDEDEEDAGGGEEDDEEDDIVGGGRGPRRSSGEADAGYAVAAERDCRGAAIRRRRSSLELARGDRPGPLDVQSFSAAKG